eukprot:CAMPEP_0183334630 /NCGR_PEP_ID=MMETSP0164_2-20130417/3182_1 /TAXON_ID=221442 /ORGANISM="Coccolithus pelagicus ssp braarudi, Strain PLY182g" /LENGTH=803 /DNA_ID=CAMNT_0025503811 /DNA_START=92 /DNA_END=2503 /DNA_ORIENTATION=-
MGFTIPVALMPLPGNTTLSPPLLSEAHILQPRVGFFRFTHTLPAATNTAHWLPVMLPLTEIGYTDRRQLAGALRALVSLNKATPLELYLAGRAHLLVQTLQLASAPMTHAATARMLRSHRYHALAFSLPAAFETALRRAFPSCAQPTLVRDLIALIAPALLTHLNALVVLDPHALLMTRVAHLWEQVQLAQRHTLLYAALDHLAPTATPDTSLLLLRLDRMRAQLWVDRVSSVIRRATLGPEARADHSFIASCPRRVFVELVGLEEPCDHTFSQCRRRQRIVFLDCAAAFAPLAHAASHHLAMVDSEAHSSLYAVCNHQLKHVAFARAAEAAYNERFPPARSCSCGRRVSVLLPVRGMSGALLPPTEPVLKVLGDSALVYQLRPSWMRYGVEETQWLEARARAAIAPRSVHAIANRAAGAATPLLVFSADPSSGRSAASVRGSGGHTAGGGVPLDAALPVVYPCGFAGAEEAFLLELMLGACRPRKVCLCDLLDAHARGRRVEVAATLRVGAVLVLQNPHFAIVEHVAAEHGVPLDGLILVHISDGNIYHASMNASAARYPPFRSAFRQYWVPDAQHSLDSSARRGDVRWFPIGMNPQWVRLVPAIANGSLRLPASSERRHFISFLGSTHKSSRAERISEVEAHSGAAVHFHAGNRACYGQDCNNQRYVEETLQSVLCLHLPGSSVESNRLYEQLEGGCVPLVVEAFGPGEAEVGTIPLEGETAIQATRSAFAPLTYVTGEPPPWLTVSHARELANVLAPFMGDASAVDVLQRRNLRWWAAAKAHFAGAFRDAACPAASSDEL